MNEHSNPALLAQAALKYLADVEQPVTYVPSRGGGDTGEHQGNYVERYVAIHDARALPHPPRLDREGFALVEHTSAVTDFYDDSQIASVYEPEIETLLARVTGATRVEIFDHTRRAASRSVQQARGIREPASIVHNDYTARSGPQRLADHLRERGDESMALLARRFAIINVWRSIAGTVYSAPLALCDAASIASGDLVAVERRARDRVGEIQLALYNCAHRWYCFARMQAGEALLIKTFDSATDGRARFTLHTAFDFPDTPADAPPRESLETRCFVWF